MFRTRTRRVLIWMGIIAVVLAIPILDRAGGEFHVRPVIRREVRAPIAGFLREINADEGDNVAADSLLTLIEVPELISNIARKKAEIAESEALLRRLECGPRQEDVDDQKARIERASSWRDLAVHDLEKARESFQAEMVALELSVEKAIALAEFQETILGEMQSLHDRGGLAGQQLLSYKKKRQDALLEASQSKANVRARSAEGVIRFESELAKREKELADSQATLTLLEAGSRREDIDAEQAHLRRLEEELNHFLRQQEKQIVLCPVSGTIITPRFKEMIGSFVERGTPLCVIEDLENLEAEISVSEKDARVLVRGQPITLKPRSLAMTTLTATVDRIAPAANPVANPADTGVSRSFTVYCNVDNSAGHLRTGMTGYARIHSKRRPLAMLIAQAGLRLIRTEFAW